MENIRYRSSIKTAFRRVVEAVQGGDAAAIETAHKDYVSLIDRATAKRALHQNTASRKKARPPPKHGFAQEGSHYARHRPRSAARGDQEAPRHA
ncbi:MAG: 30S ribosomal protein S20 [Actinobacteria bacterium]|nr:30S ribosomal protein S20 [Actinomycetota bacterium]